MIKEYKLKYTGKEVEDKLSTMVTKSYMDEVVEDKSREAALDVVTGFSQVEPLFANSIDECTDTTKVYVLPDGYLYAYMKTEIAGGANYTNLVPTSTDTDGSIYNGTGYKDNVRLSSSGGVSGSAQSNSVTTGFMPWTSCGVIRIKGALWNSVDTSKHYYVNFYDASKAFTYYVAAREVIGSTTSPYNLISVSYDEATDVTTIDTTAISSHSGTAGVSGAIKNGIYFRLTAVGSGENLIVTVNEEIKESATVVDYAWANTGHAFVPADYEDRIIILERENDENADAVASLKQQVDDIVDGTTNITASTKFDPTVYNLPVLYLTGDISPVFVSKDNSVTLNYTYKGYSGTCTLKGQGATSYKMAKEFIDAGKAGKFNYTITFDNAFEAVSGWGSQKKYCLKANWIDHSHARNVVSAKLWGRVVKSRPDVSTALSTLPNGGAIDGFPVVIVLNDEFYGLYTFNIPKDGWMLGMIEDSTKTQAIVCAKDHTECTQFKAVGTSGFEVEFASDESNAEWITTSLTRLVSACVNSNGTDIDTAVAPYLDIDSAIDYYLHVVMLRGGDMVDKNYLLCTFDGVKWFFNAYDMDSTFGLAWDASQLDRPVTNINFVECAAKNHVFELLKNYKKEDIKARYAELRGDTFSESRMAQLFENFAWDISIPLLVEDVKLYPTIRGSSVNGIDQICRWTRQRLEACDRWVDEL